MGMTAAGCHFFELIRDQKVTYSVLKLLSELLILAFNIFSKPKLRLDYYFWFLNVFLKLDIIKDRKVHKTVNQTNKFPIKNAVHDGSF